MVCVEECCCVGYCCFFGGIRPVAILNMLKIEIPIAATLAIIQNLQKSLQKYNGAVLCACGKIARSTKLHCANSL